jgi:N-acetylmuramoyl-L-alanine amidase
MAATRLMRRVVYGVLVSSLWPGLAGAVVLERIRVVPGPHPAVELAVSGAVVPWVRRLAATADSPHRIYIDLADTTLAPGVRKVVPAPAPGIERIRAGQFTPTTARIVLDTTSERSFDVAAMQRRVVITLAPPPPAAAVPGVAAAVPGVAAAVPEAAAAVPEAATAVPAVEAPAPTPSPAPPPVTTPAPRLPLIVVDPGHGGHDPGAEGVGGVLEKTVSLQIAHRLAAKLPARLPVDSLLTRSDDSFVPLSARLPHGRTPNAIFLSLHANACDHPGPHGLEIFFSGGRAEPLARFIARELRVRLLRVRGRPRPGPFRVLTANHAPSVLIELGYLTHRDDAARLQDPRYQEVLTDALVDAVAAFLQGESGMHAGQDLVPSGNARGADSAGAAAG